MCRKLLAYINTLESVPEINQYRTISVKFLAQGNNGFSLKDFEPINNVCNYSSDLAAIKQIIYDSEMFNWKDPIFHRMNQVNSVLIISTEQLINHWAVTAKHLQVYTREKIGKEQSPHEDYYKFVIIFLFAFISGITMKTQFIQSYLWIKVNQGVDSTWSYTQVVFIWRLFVLFYQEGLLKCGLYLAGWSLFGGGI